MRMGLYGSLVTALAAAGLAWAEPPPIPVPPSAPGLKTMEGSRQSPVMLAQAAPPGPKADGGSTMAPTDAAAATTAPIIDEFRDCHCGPPHRFWFGADILLWWIEDAPLPVPLATTSGVASRGVLGAPDTTIVSGNSDVDFGNFFGLRLSGGMWLNERHTVGVELTGFRLEQNSQFSSISSDAAGNPLLARPFRDVAAGVDNALLVSFPGAFAGSFATGTNSSVWGAEINIVRNITYWPTCSLDLVFGFRYLDLDESLRMYQSTTALAGGALVFGGAVLAPPASVLLTDSFATRNQFYGGQIGARMHRQLGPAYVDLISKVALGPNHQSINISGNTVATSPTVSGTLPGGFLALAGGNIGRATTNWFVVVPEVALQVGVQVTERLGAHIGLSGIYVNNVVRPGDQVNLSVNPRLAPTSLAFGSATGPAQPVLPFQRSDFWVYGFNFGMEFKY